LKFEISNPRAGHRGVGRLALALAFQVSVSCALLILDLGALAAEPTNHNAVPFLRFRSRTLEYNGPRDDLTNLTEIRIGWFGPHDLTNHLGADMWWAANRAVREANDRGGLSGLPFRLVPRWAANPWGSGVAQLTRMVYDDQPLALLGSMDSASTHLAEQVVAKANLPLLSPVATDKSVTLAGVSWMFACAPADNAIARPLVEAVLAELQNPSSRLVLLSVTDHESRMITGEVLKEFSRRGRLPDFRFEAPPGVNEVTTQMSALREAKPTAILIIAGVEDTARLVRTAREKVPAAILFGSQAMGRTRFGQLAGPAADDVRFPLLFTPNLADTNSKCFIDCFTTEHGYAPDYAAALTYDATRLLIDAICQAGPSRAQIREALAQLSPWTGIAGSISFDGTGQNTRSNICLGTIRHGTIVPVKS
jgi:branched-chain amino acid transport system substrate-binding protein